jgi:hypothetical protein
MDLPISRAPPVASPFAVGVVLLNNLDHIVARHTMPLFHNDAPRPRRLPPLLDNNLRAPAGPPRAPADLAHLGAAIGLRPSAMRIAPWPAHDNLLLACHCRGGAGLAVGVHERLDQPANQQEAGDAAEDDADNSAGLGAREVVVGRYYALLDRLRVYDILALGYWRTLGCLEENGGDVSNRLAHVQGRVAGRSERIIGLSYGRHRDF